MPRVELMRRSGVGRAYRPEVYFRMLAEVVEYLEGRRLARAGD